MRKMKHFLTLILSHRKLKYSEYFIPFLCESDKIFELTIKINEIDQENEEKVEDKGWFSYARSSISNVVSTAQNIKIKTLVPQFVNYITGSQHSDDEDQDLSKLEKGIEKLKLSFVEFYELLSNIQLCREEECKMERNLRFILDNVPEFDNINNTELLNAVSQSAKKQSDAAYENSNHLIDLIYASESHLVWIESVQDLIARTHSFINRTNEMKTKISITKSQKGEINLYKELICLTQRKEEMNTGVKKEVERLKIGTADFYERWAYNGLILNQYEYFKTISNLIDIK